MEALLDKIAEMADDPDFPRNYDLCVSVLSSNFPLLHLIPDLDQVSQITVQKFSRRLLTTLLSTLGNEEG